VTAEDRNAHREFVRALGGAAIWLDYLRSGVWHHEKGAGILARPFFMRFSR
jgi:hypothetical protein